VRFVSDDFGRRLDNNHIVNWLWELRLRRWRRIGDSRRIVIL
jgi:hypothetical protein